MDSKYIYFILLDVDNEREFKCFLFPTNLIQIFNIFLKDVMTRWPSG